MTCEYCKRKFTTDGKLQLHFLTCPVRKRYLTMQYIIEDMDRQLTEANKKLKLEKVKRNKHKQKYMIKCKELEEIEFELKDMKLKYLNLVGGC